MSRVVVAYVNGRPVYRDDGPARARVSGYGHGSLHTLTLIGQLHEPRQPGDSRGLPGERHADPKATHR